MYYSNSSIVSVSLTSLTNNFLGTDSYGSLQTSVHIPLLIQGNDGQSLNRTTHSIIQRHFLQGALLSVLRQSSSVLGHFSNSFSNSNDIIVLRMSNMELHEASFAHRLVISASACHL